MLFLNHGRHGKNTELGLRACDLGLVTWDLGLGTWDLGLGTWDLGLGTWDLGLGTLLNHSVRKGCVAVLELAYIYDRF